MRTIHLFLFFSALFHFALVFPWVKNDTCLFDLNLKVGMTSPHIPVRVADVSTKLRELITEIIEIEKKEEKEEEPKSKKTIGAEWVNKEDYLNNEPPAYPWIAQKRGYQGLVVIHINVNEEGKVIGASVQESSGFESLDVAALETAKTWTLGMASGNKRIIKIPFRFKLNE